MQRTMTEISRLEDRIAACIRNAEQAPTQHHFRSQIARATSLQARKRKLEQELRQAARERWAELRMEADLEDGQQRSKLARRLTKWATEGRDEPILAAWATR